MTCVFFRLLQSDDKPAALADATAALRDGRPANPVVHVVNPASFRQVPGSPFAYWVSERIRRLFTELPPFESEGREARRGASTGDDGRRVRTWWEVSDLSISRNKRWVSFSKGGAYSPFYADVHLLVGWDESRKTFEGFFGRPGRLIERPEALPYFFRAGCTWSRRSQRGLSLRALPSACIFADKGPTAFACEAERWPLLGLANSRAFHALVLLQMAFGSYEVGVIQKTPVPDLSHPDGQRVGKLAHAATELKRSLDTASETSHAFHVPAMLQAADATLAKRIAARQAFVADADRQLTECQREIDDITFRLYGIDGEDRRAIESSAGSYQSSVEEADDETESADDEPQTTDHGQLTKDIFSYAFGCVLGRWDVRYATSERQPPELPDPFAPLPVCSPGMLQGPDGLPLRETPAGYPLRIDWDGILVDDQEHPDDIIRRVREVLELVWKDRAEAIEQEACEIFSGQELRDYFRKPGAGGFWDDHVKRYSKSRRKAPIYWLLQSKYKNYALWLYYHRLDKDILFKALVNYVEPKIQRETNRLGELRRQKQATGESGRGAKKLDKDIERQDNLISELRQFDDKLRRAANLHLEPDLNDGVVLNIAPLHELVPWKEAKNYWDELREGEYEWSSIGKQLRAKGLVQ